MPKTPKDFADFTWPWKKGEVDEEKAARLIHSLKVEREDFQEKNAALREQNVTLTEERDSLKDAAEASGKTGDDKDAEITQLKKDLRAKDRAVTDLTKERDTLAPKAVLADRYDAALTKGLTKTQAHRLVGNTVDELLADADVLRADLGLTDGDDDGGEQGGDRGSTQYGDVRVMNRLRTGTEGLDSQAGETNPAKVSLPPL